MKMLTSSHYRRASGFSLIEVMVSVLVIAVGVLGMAGMQVAAKRAAHEAVQRTTAANLAMDMLERMRANTGSLASYVTTGVGGGTITSEPAPVCFGSNTCTAAQLAAHDLWQWEQAIDGATETLGSGESKTSTGGLFDPTGCIAVSSGTVTIAMAWEGYSAMSNPAGNTCGSGLSKYGTNDAKRQLLEMTTFITTQ